MKFGEEKPEIQKTGTTTVGIICKDGAIMAAEKKSTMGYLVASKETEKILPLSEHIAMTVAGSSADAQALGRYMKAELKLFQIQNKRSITVKGAATLMANILQNGRWTYLPYMVQLMIGGFDTGPHVFSMDAIGAIEDEKKFFSTGSGSPMALGVLEDTYKEGISVAEGAKLAERAIRAAVERDIASGGKGVDIATITKDGIKVETRDFK
jgi:proteasome beta subunit